MATKPSTTRASAKGEEVRIARTIARVMVMAAIEGKSWRKRQRALQVLIDTAERLQREALSYENVYVITGGRYQEVDRSVVADALRACKKVASDALFEIAEARLRAEIRQ